MTDSVTIRDADPRDAAGWRALWTGYLTFYEEDLADDVTARTWARLIDPDVPEMASLVCETADHKLVGMLNYVVHPITWSSHPVCYLEDLFVDESVRGQGIARKLIEHLSSRGRSLGWHRIYWNTARDNTQAQILYNKVAERTGWVRYDIDLD